ncbi:DUF2225 domain-containing protein [Heliobacterium gestii]|uniref:DUF2225 domain-containing protein n=1 Tax=Heliomicrobium gestii TaxID=2699 RepID=A0A845LCR0_HELGE|nr:DUF2225 domain-containing protein [Heliomicrobium gestii]MBM7867473.1 uncharacterized protein (DUF2225 family) [Heliomicrobium gestii]MZP43978.1 DUF2225 domain-containing protein [Heliomicrobium gestii]
MIGIGQLAQSGHLREFVADDVIFQEGEPGKEMYIVLTGQVEVFIHSVDGFPIAVATLGPGDFFGEMSLLEELPRSASVRALEKVILLEINQGNFESIFSRQPQLVFKIMKGMSGRIRQLNEELRRLKQGRRPHLATPSSPAPSPAPAPSIPSPSSPSGNAVAAVKAHPAASTAAGQGAKTAVTTSATGTGIVTGTGAGAPAAGTAPPDPRAAIPAAKSAASAGAPLPPALATSGLFPEGHRQYGASTTVADEAYLFDKKTACPICNHNFDIKAIRSSKQKLKSVDADFRQHFHDFEPLWYMIWVCPNCYYANFNFEYTQLSEIVKKQFRTKPARLSFPRLPFQYSHPRTVDQVFTAYYLTLFFLQSGMPDPSRIAKVWLRISWLYDDVGDQDMSHFTALKALEFFRQSYYGTNRSTSIDQDQRLSILLGELSMRNEDYEEALKFFRGGIANRGGNPTLNRQASDRYQDVKKLLTDIKATQEEPETADAKGGEPTA